MTKHGYGLVLMAGLWAGLCAGAWASEPACYLTADAAAAQSGVRGVDGFRLEGRQRDVFSGAVWATVRSCAHPERPGVLVMGAGEVGRPGPGKVAEAGMVLVAGTKVTLTQNEGVVHIEMQAVAQGSGAVGDRVRVRLLTVSPEGGERFAEGVVRGGHAVELVGR
jgi:hypothetical protein